MAQVLVIALIGVLAVVLIVAWIFLQVIESISAAKETLKRRSLFLKERKQKYKDRKIDRALPLPDRNRDIIQQFTSALASSSKYSFKCDEIGDATRDCINEICVAEGRMGLSPGGSSVYKWKGSVPKEWAMLAEKIEAGLREAKKQEESRKQATQIAGRKRADELESNIRRIKSELWTRIKERCDPEEHRKLKKYQLGSGDILLSHLQAVMTLNETTWTEKEATLLIDRQLEKFPLISDDLCNPSVKELNREISQYNSEMEKDLIKQSCNKMFFQDVLKGYRDGVLSCVIERINFIISEIVFPRSLPKDWEIDFNKDEGVVIVEVALPDVVHSQILKEVPLKAGMSLKPLNQQEKRGVIPKFHPAIVLRIASEIFRNDIADVVKLLVINGWVEFDNPNTGIRCRMYTASLAVKKNQMEVLKLNKLDPVSAFATLKGRSAGRLIDIIPVDPVLSLNREDKRFVETRPLLDNLLNETNLASIDWQDFESLIAELFQKEFAKEGVEVKVTQASRDRGVDAVVFDPDPIKGGKFVIQAKRYTNTVDVSAVRDLCAVVKKEGASRGILVTTSTFGSDAYAFAHNEPITLLNGGQLLGLLEKHNYKFRIDLEEARRALVAEVKCPSK